MTSSPSLSSLIIPSIPSSPARPMAFPASLIDPPYPIFTRSCTTSSFNSNFLHTHYSLSREQTQTPTPPPNSPERRVLVYRAIRLVPDILLPRQLDCSPPPPPPSSPVLFSGPPPLLPPVRNHRRASGRTNIRLNVSYRPMPPPPTPLAYPLCQRPAWPAERRAETALPGYSEVGGWFWTGAEPFVEPVDALAILIRASRAAFTASSEGNASATSGLSKTRL